MDATGTHPLSLFEAMSTWGEPAAVAVMTRLVKDGYDGPSCGFLGGPETEYERNVSRYRELRERLETALVARLRDGSLVAVGYDSRAAIDAPPVAIPAGRWRVLIPNFEDSSAAGGGLAISGILVSGFSNSVAPAGVPSPEPRLRITRPGRRARFDGTDLRLTPRSFDLLVILAEGMLQSAAPVEKRHLEDRLLVGNFSEKAIGQAVNRLKSELMKSGVCRENAQSLIENVRAAGYRLTLSASDIQIDD
jgi:Transcriptional regulatory protein, C terminal